MTKLSVLIPTTPDRAHFLRELINQFYQQLGRAIEQQIGPETGLPNQGIGMHYERMKYSDGVEVLIAHDDFQNSIGFKRNCLLQNALGEYIEFIDSDDRIGEKHFEHVLAGIATGADCCSLKGIITEDGQKPLIFEHSIKYYEYRTNPDAVPMRDVTYERYPNHISCIKASIAKQFRFPEKNHGEDTDWATQIFKSGAIKTEHYIDDVIYHYEYRSKK